ncbi:MAG TPA: hypothetical protein VL068_06295 [Microthrixaceae bacterium]|nr:hypothetical protein [Microthrixaceae bacterium]
MNDFDEQIRTGLADATKGAGGIDSEVLAARLMARQGSEAAGSTAGSPAPSAATSASTEAGNVVSITDGRASSHQGRGKRWLSVAAAVALLAGAAGFGVWRANNGDATHLVTANRDPVARGFDSWTPGWHEIDPGPVPPSAGVSMAYFDNRVVVANTTRSAVSNASSNLVPKAGVWAFDPRDESWSTLPTPPFETVSLVSAGEQLVAVGGPANLQSTQLERPMRWATWSPGESRWTDRGSLPVEHALQVLGTAGPSGPGGDSLVWTGNRVINVTRGAVLDPATGTATELDLPGNLIDYAHLISSTPVWTGDVLVLSSWSRNPGLAYDSLGKRLADIPGLAMADPDLSVGATGVAVDGRVVLVAREGQATGRSASFDPESGQWTELPTVQEPKEPRWCPPTSASVDNEIVLQPCHSLKGEFVALSNPLVLRAGKWEPIPLPPQSERGVDTWLGTDEALVAWTSESEVEYNPEAPFRWAAVWIPGPGDGRKPVNSSKPATSKAGSSSTGSSVPNSRPAVPDDCFVNKLPDLGSVLPASMDFGPNPGVGGTGSSEGCYRHWGSTTDTSIYLTQHQGLSIFHSTPERKDGDFASFGIEGGFAFEYLGTPAWSAEVYGISRAEFDKMVNALVANPPS